jgi:HlyD family secretion protein
MARIKKIIQGSKENTSFRILSVLGLLFFFLCLLVFHSGCGSSSDTEDQEQRVDLNFEPSQIVGIGRIEPEDKILDIASALSGIVVVLPVEAGDQLLKDEIILELDSEVEKARLEQAAARIQTQLAQIEASKAALSAERIRAENARLFFERTEALFKEGAETEYNYDLAKTEYESLVEENKRLEASVVSAEKMLRQYGADQLLAKAEYEKRFIRAPSDGQLLSLDIRLGSLVTPQKNIGAFAPAGPLSAWVEIDELFASKVQKGQRAYIRQQGTTEPLAWGEVGFVGPYLRKKSIFSDEIGDLQDRRVREVRITLDPEADVLFGARVECVVLLEDR